MLEDMTYGSQSVWGALFEMPQQFFVERADQSQVKALIVSRELRYLVQNHRTEHNAL